MPTTLTLTAAGQPAQVLTVPTKWSDCTLGQFVALHAPNPDDTRRPAEILLSLPAGGLDTLAAADVVYLANLLAFAADPADVLALLPSTDLPDVGGLPWGCLLLVQQQLQQEPERPPLAYLPYVLAVYRAQLAYGNTDRAASIEAALLAGPVTECYADGAFFLAAARRSLSGTPQTKATTPSPATKNSKPIPTPRWLRALGTRLRSTWRPGATS